MFINIFINVQDAPKRGKESSASRGSFVDNLNAGVESSDQTIFSVAGPVLFSASRDKTVKMWDPIKGICLQTFVRPKKSGVTRVVTSSIFFAGRAFELGEGDFYPSWWNEPSDLFR